MYCACYFNFVTGSKKPTSFEAAGLIAIVVELILQLLCQQGDLAGSRGNSLLALGFALVCCLIGVQFELNFDFSCNIGLEIFFSKAFFIAINL